LIKKQAILYAEMAHPNPVLQILPESEDTDKLQNTMVLEKLTNMGTANLPQTEEDRIDQH
jgi:hypothetical protein